VNQHQSNPLLHELARGNRTEPHPDEDVLTAFAEHALLDRERETVMQHLSTCAQCREVLSLTAAAIPEAMIQEKLHILPVRPHYLRWIAGAAALAVVASAVLLHDRNARRPQQPVNPAVSVATVEAPPPLGNQPSQRVMAPEQATVRKQTPTRAAKTVPTPQQNQSSTVASLDRSEQKVGAQQPEAAQAKRSLVIDALKPEIASRTQEAHRPVSAQANSMSQSAFHGAAAAPALTEGSAPGLSAGLTGASARTHWRIGAAGQAERSFDNGPWTPVKPDATTRIRVVSVFGSEVWLGGEDLRLYHSQDDGTTWHLVPLLSKRSGEHAITHIRFESKQAGTVEADEGTQWTTVDGGRTWK
jgi:Photosynthesis system II assembly factor YCF48